MSYVFERKFKKVLDKRASWVYIVFDDRCPPAVLKVGAHKSDPIGARPAAGGVIPKE